MTSKKNRLTPLTVRFPDDAFEALKAHADAQGVSMSAAASQAVELSLDRALMLDRFELLTLQVAGNAARQVDAAVAELTDAVADAKHVLGDIVSAAAEQAGTQKAVIEHLTSMVNAAQATGTRNSTSSSSAGWTRGQAVPD
jgi:hypothetical protein